LENRSHKASRALQDRVFSLDSADWIRLEYK
jgi:hypothetical protein